MPELPNLLSQLLHLIVGLSLDNIKGMYAVLNNEYMTVSEVAEALNVSRQRVHALITRGQLAAIQVTDKLRMVEVEEFKRFKKIPRPTGVHVDRRPRRTKKTA